jgi:4-diphosphocytidyl-2C-methyl-D-erythritol kinase/very-short-patch-repair endonuclease
MKQLKVKCPAKTTANLGEQSESLELRRPALDAGSQSLRVKCPAKINLTLEILNKRPDGFHDIQSVMQTIDLFDFLTIEISESPNSEIKLSGTNDEIPYDERNLVHKAVMLFFDKLNSSPLVGEGVRRTDEGFKKIINQRAKLLRKDSTLPEQILWHYLRDRRFDGLKFRRQVPIKKYIADFVCFEKKLIIELDGSGHLQDKTIKYDKKREDFLTTEGFTVLRYYNTDIFKNIETVLEEIYRYTSKTPHPNPLPQGARGETKIDVIHEECQESNTLLPCVGEGGVTPDEGEYQNYKISVHIEKNIPISAGLAGGSTDAAGTLWGLNKLFDNRLSKEELHALCAKLGSDLNFCLEGGCQLTTGRGEILERLPFCEFGLSLIKPKDLGISAKEAYTKFSELKNKPNLNMTTKLVDALNLGKTNVENFLHNDLEVAVFDDYEELKQIKKTYPTSIMSGSGSTYFIIGQHELTGISKEFWVKTGLLSINYGVSEAL